MVTRESLERGREGIGVCMDTGIRIDCNPIAKLERFSHWRELNETPS